MRGSLIVAGGTAALALAGPFALRPFVDAAGAAGTAGETSVAFVLDFGGSPDREVTGCVTVPDSDNDYDALAAFTAEHGLAAPTYNTSQLLCSINGDPATGCGQEVSDGYVYWSYFTGGADHWTYADSGAFGSVVKLDGAPDVEGWRFQDPGTGLPNDPPPHTAPDYSALCSRAHPTTAPTTPAPTPASSGGGPKKTGAVATGRTRALARAKARRAKAVAKAAATPCPSSSSTTTSTSRPLTPVTTTTLPPSCGLSSTTTTTAIQQPVTTTSPPPVNIPADPETGLASVSKPEKSGAGPDPLILGGLVVAILAIAASARWRKRPRSP